MHMQLRTAAIATGLVAAALVLTTTSAFAVEGADTKAAEPSIYDKIWGYTKLYSNPNNPWVEDVSIVGREQVDFYYFDGTQQDATNFANRRTRLGLKTQLFQTVTVHGEVDLNLEGQGEVYGKITDAYVKWAPEKWLNLTVGKQSAKFTLEGATSSTQLITTERSNIANNFWFPDEYIPGVSVSGNVDNWMYNAGWFSGGSKNEEFGEFNAGSFLLMSGGYDFAKMLDSKKALLRLDYVWQDTDPKNGFTRPEQDVLSLNFQLEKGRWGLWTDLDLSKGYKSQSDLVGAEIMPSVMFCDTWQAVVRYTGIGSSDDNGIRLNRYENKVTKGNGDEYHEIYLGLNKYFYGHKLKWQSGIMYTTMNDQAGDGGNVEGWGITTGLRVYW